MVGAVEESGRVEHALRGAMLTESILETLEELVFDANEVVTYKWVSRQWELHANLAKRLLDDFVVRQRRAGKSLCCWHAVLAADSVTLVPDAELARNLRGRPPESSRVHIYAVLTSRTEDANVVYLADMRSSPCRDVKCSSVKPRSPS